MISRTPSRAKSAHSVATETKRPPFPKGDTEHANPLGQGAKDKCVRLTWALRQ